MKTQIDGHMRCGYRRTLADIGFPIEGDMQRILLQLIGAGTLACALVATPASAAPRQPAAKAPSTADAGDAHAAAEALAFEAKALFGAKKFPEAAKRFMEAYAKEPQPPLVFNAARAYAEAGMTGEAMGLFRLSTAPQP